MKILIVEDYDSLRELLAHMVKNQRDGIEVLEAGCLDEARDLAPQADAVLSDGNFPTHAPRWYEPPSGATHSTNYAPLLNDCKAAGIPFVLLSGQDELVERLRKEGHLAFDKLGENLDAVQAVVREAEVKVLEKLNKAGR